MIFTTKRYEVFYELPRGKNKGDTMDYIGNINYWDVKFKERSNSPLNPDNELVKNTNLLLNGTVLDVACGDGRNSLYLLRQNFKVTGVDFSSEALARLENFAKQNKFEISIFQIDLTKKNSLDSIGTFDNIIVNHYKLQKNQMKKISNHLNKNGILFITGFAHKHETNEKIKDGDLIKEEDFELLRRDFKLIYYNEYRDIRGFFVTYIYKKY